MTHTAPLHWPGVLYDEHLATVIELHPFHGRHGRDATVGSFIAADVRVHPFVRAAGLSMSDQDRDAIAKALGFATYAEGYSAFLDMTFPKTSGTIRK